MANSGESKSVKLRDILLVLSSGIVALGLIAFFARQWDIDVPELVGKPAPEIEYEVKNGRSTSLSKQQGSAILINFWATWCEPCMSEMPTLRMLESHYAAKGLLVLAFNVEEAVGENIRTQLAGNKMPRNLIFNFSKEQLRPYQVQSIPLSVLIDKKGIVKQIYRGPRNWMDISILREIDGALKSE